MTLNISVAIGLILIGWLVKSFGIFMNAVAVLIIISVAAQLIRVATCAWRGTLDLRLFKTPFGSELRSVRLQVLNRWLFWLAAGLVMEICVVPSQFDPSEVATIHVFYWIMIGLLMLLELFPGRAIYLPVNAALTIGWLFIAIQILAIYQPPNHTDAVRLLTPFRGTWVIVQGGDSSLINHHYSVTAQRYAVDVDKVVDGQDRVGARSRRESYLAWAETLYSPTEGKVIAVANDYEDNAIGQTDRVHIVGNHIVIDMGGGRFVLMAHLMKGSVTVGVGTEVRAGQAIARCGNSGNTAAPHLHLQVQSRPDMFSPGTQTYPIVFSGAKCFRSGRERHDEPFYVRRNDLLVRD